MHFNSANAQNYAEMENELLKMYQLNRELQGANAAMQNDYARLLQKVEPAEQGKKRKLLDRKLATLAGGEMVIVNIYERGYSEIGFRFTDIRGPWKTYRLRLEEDWEQALFALHFEGTDDWIPGQISKIKKTYFYDLLVKYGAHFDTMMNRNAICQALYESFSGEICMTSNEVQISALAGWKNGRFQFRENFILKDQLYALDFPVMQKSFEVLGYDESIPQRYFAEMIKIKNKKDRFIVMVYPFVSLISSILSQHGRPLNFGINFIDLCGMDKSRICGWFQNFNRKVCMPLSSGKTEKQFEKILHAIKDEVLILENVKSADATYYNKKEKQRRINTALHVVLGGEGLEGRSSEPVCAGVAVISDQFQSGKDVYNIYAPDDWCEEEDEIFRKDKVMTKLFSDFVRYAEKNMDEIEEAIMKKRDCQDKKEELLEIGCEILEKYWGKKGLDFKQSAGLDEEISFKSFFEEAAYEEEELLELFIKSFRRGAEQYFFLPKKAKQRGEDTIYFDDDYLYILVNIFDTILCSAGLKELKAQIMELLKREKILVTDAEGLSKRIMVGGEREEMYRLQRYAFQTEKYLLDIVELGRESDAV